MPKADKWMRRFEIVPFIQLEVYGDRIRVHGTSRDPTMPINIALPEVKQMKLKGLVGLRAGLRKPT